MKKYICADIGGTSIKHGVLTETEEFLTVGSTPTEAKRFGGAGIVEKLHAIVHMYSEEYQIEGVCISTAGMVDIEKGVITYSAPLIPNYIGTNLKAEIENTFHLPCEVENDVNCAGLAEFYSGAAKGSESCLCLTVGTGIGGAFIQNGTVHHGFSGSGCEIGYMHLPGGEFQDLGSVSALIEKVENIKNLPPNSLNGKMISEQAKNGDIDCIRAVDEMCDVLGMGIANICYVLNPQVVVLGGGIMQDKNLLLPKLCGSLGKYLLHAVFEKTRVTTAQYGNHAGMLGAYYHFRNRRSRDCRI